MMDATIPAHGGVGQRAEQSSLGWMGQLEEPWSSAVLGPGLTRLHAGWATLAGPLSFSVCIYATGIKMPPHGIVVKVEQDDKPAVWEAPSLLPWSPP